MRELEDISELIGLIYDASLDPALWPGVLGHAARFLPGMSAALFAKNSSKTGNVYYDDGGLDPHYKQIYFEKYVQLDPLNNAHVFAAVEETVSTEDFTSYAEFVQSRFYREWVKPQRIADFICAVLDKSATGAALFGIFRHERDGLVDADVRRRMGLIVPHVRRAALIGKVIDLKRAEAATFADALDGIAAGMFLLDSRGQMVHVNLAGSAMLAEGNVLRPFAGRVVACEAAASQSLSETLACAASDEMLGTKGIALPLTGSSGERYIAHVLPLTSGTRRDAGTKLGATIALFVHKASLQRAGPTEIIAKTYNLTPAELRVLLAVVDVGGGPEVADALGVAEGTVKFHLKSLFQKTGSRRQVDLVKIVASYLNLPTG